ncbi:HEC/Ndc80p family-domain-containing protein [Blastocladiella britannica]|nr:HEC/Ndc80p family-domain-containing protein [Blastocladiella britannica]
MSNSRPDPRRGSLFPGSGGGAGGKNAAPSDPRNIKTKAFMREATSRLHACFVQAGEHSLPLKTLVSPTNRDWARMFTLLYLKLDPTYQFGHGNFADEVASIMRGQLRYPFEANISKSALGTANASNHWPNFVALMDWMRELLELGDLLRPQQLTDNGSDKAEIFKRLVDAKNQKADGATDEEVAADIRTGYEQRNAELEAEIKAMTQRLQATMGEYHALESTESPLAPLLKEFEQTRSEDAELDQLQSELDHELNKAAAALADEESDVRRLDSELGSVQAEQHQVTERIAAQEISIVEAKDMASQREVLMREIATLDRERLHLEDLKYDRAGEARAARDAAARALGQFRDAGKRLGLLPTGASELARSLKADFELVTLHPSAPDPAVLTAAAARDAARPALVTLRAQQRDHLRVLTRDLSVFEGRLEELDAAAAELSRTDATLRATMLRLTEDINALNARASDEGARVRRVALEQEHEARTHESAVAPAELLNWDSRLQKVSYERELTERETTKRLHDAASEALSLIERIHLEQGTVHKFVADIKAELSRFSSMADAMVAKTEQSVAAAAAAATVGHDDPIMDQSYTAASRG